MSKYLVFQITSRRNYDLASILAKENKLSFLITDFYNKGTFLDIIFKNLFRKFERFNNKNISNNHVISSYVAGIFYRFAIRFFSKSYFNSAIGFSSKILLKKSFSVDENKFDNIVSFDTNAYNIFEKYYLKKKLILEQCVAPRTSQISMYRSLSDKYAINLNQHILNCTKFLKKESQELKFSSMIICPSNYVRDELIRININKSKIFVIPYGFTNPLKHSSLTKNIQKKLKSDDFNLLFVGNEAIRKGVLDIIKVAEKLKDNERIFFHIVGDVKRELNNFNIVNIPRNVKFYGKLDKESLNRLYLKSNLFIMPSYLEGSALVNYEAISFGIPLLTTYSSGSVIRDNKEGFYVDPGDIDMLIKKILSLYLDKKKQLQFSMNALKLSKLYTLEKYQNRLKAILK